MPRFGPTKRKELIRYLRKIGFEGSFSGGKHQFMVREDVTILNLYPIPTEEK
jgi:predicted RNA binding protein YcfA (HicA-like mRNA interferase family)